MARSGSSSKRAEWRKRLERYRRSGLVVSRFCRREGISTASFYSWRKRLDGAGAAGKSELARFQPVRLTGAGAVMSVHLPGGVRVEVPMENLDGVRAVVGELMRQGTCGDGGEEAVTSGAGGSPC